MIPYRAVGRALMEVDVEFDVKKWDIVWLERMRLPDIIY